MAFDTRLDLTGLSHLWDKIKALVPAKSKKTQGIFYGEIDSTSTSTVMTATVDGITELADGVAVLLKNGVVTSASGWTLNINNLGAKPVYSSMASATRITTAYNINYTWLFVYDSDRVDGGCWIAYYGYYSDANTIGYIIRTNYSALPLSSAIGRYRLMFTSADGTKYVPATASTSTNATSARTVTQTPIDPFGRITYYNYTTIKQAGEMAGVSYVCDQNAVTLGYSFAKGSALTMTPWKPVYLKCQPQSDGSAIIDATTPWVQDLPNTEDGKIYIFLGVAYSATNIELMLHHPVYEYKNGAVRLWTNNPVREIPDATGEPDTKSCMTVKPSTALTLAPTANPLVVTLDASTSVGTAFTADGTGIVCNKEMDVLISGNCTWRSGGASVVTEASIRQMGSGVQVRTGFAGGLSGVQNQHTITLSPFILHVQQNDTIQMTIKIFSGTANGDYTLNVGENWLTVQEL